MLYLNHETIAKPEGNGWLVQSTAGKTLLRLLEPSGNTRTPAITEVPFGQSVRLLEKEDLTGAFRGPFCHLIFLITTQRVFALCPKTAVTEKAWYGRDRKELSDEESGNDPSIEEHSDSDETSDVDVSTVRIFQHNGFVIQNERSLMFVCEGMLMLASSTSTGTHWSGEVAADSGITESISSVRVVGHSRTVSHTESSFVQRGGQKGNLLYCLRPESASSEFLSRRSGDPEPINRIFGDPETSPALRASCPDGYEVYPVPATPLQRLIYFVPQRRVIIIKDMHDTCWMCTPRGFRKVEDWQRVCDPETIDIYQKCGKGSWYSLGVFPGMEVKFSNRSYSIREEDRWQVVCSSSGKLRTVATIISSHEKQTRKDNAPAVTPIEKGSEIVLHPVEKMTEMFFLSAGETRWMFLLFYTSLLIWEESDQESEHDQRPIYLADVGLRCCVHNEHLVAWIDDTKLYTIIMDPKRDREVPSLLSALKVSSFEEDQASYVVGHTRLSFERYSSTGRSVFFVLRPGSEQVEFYPDPEQEEDVDRSFLGVIYLVPHKSIILLQDDKGRSWVSSLDPTVKSFMVHESDNQKVIWSFDRTDRQVATSVRVKIGPVVTPEIELLASFLEVVRED